MRYGSVCSGIEAATAGWHRLGWEPAFFSEIEKFPCAVLQYHYPDVPLHGDFTTIKENEYGKIDLLIGGTPCQSFSVAGLRGGLDDDRGNLALEFCRLAQREQPRWLVWENVPGVLSSNGGRDFGSILGALEELRYGLAYRVLDAQYFGVAQRRRRVFVVGHLGDWRPAAAVLFERHSMSGSPAQSGSARQEVANQTKGCTGRSGCIEWERPKIVGPLTAGMHKGARGTEAVESGHIVSTTHSPVRRLTPVECERLQGFPDNFTAIPWRNKQAENCPDGPRYKALGNSMAVPVMRWIGERIQMVEDLKI